MALTKFNYNSFDVTSAASTALGFNANANGFATVSPGSMTLIKTITASNASTTSFVDGSSSVVFDNTYPVYMVKLINIHNDTSDKYLQINFSVDTGSNYNVAKTTTAFNAAHKEDGSYSVLQYETSVDLGQGTGAQRLTAGQDNAADTGHSGTIYIFNPSSTTFVKHFMSDISTTGFDGSNEYNYHTFIAGYCNTTSAVDAFQFSINSGTHDGTIKLYGIKDS
jgi:hypothetical protein